MTHPTRIGLLFIAYLATTLIAGCGDSQNDRLKLRGVPGPDRYCLDAQQVISGSDYRVWVTVQPDARAFVQARTNLDGPDIQQYNWTDEKGDVVAISCKLISADALNRRFGEGTGGPEGRCQDMNQAIFLNVRTGVWDDDPAYDRIVFDSQNAGDESDWMQPYTATFTDDDGALHIVTRELRTADSHQCHLLAPDYMRALIRGQADPGIVIGQATTRSSQRPPLCQQSCRGSQESRPAARG